MLIFLNPFYNYRRNPLFDYLFSINFFSELYIYYADSICLYEAINIFSKFKILKIH